MDVMCSLNGSTDSNIVVEWFAHLHHQDFLWLRSECASICLYTTVEGAQTPRIGMTLM